MGALDYIRNNKLIGYVSGVVLSFVSLFASRLFGVSTYFESIANWTYSVPAFFAIWGIIGVISFFYKKD